jgi:hypothetical protein
MVRKGMRPWGTDPRHPRIRSRPRRKSANRNRAEEGAGYAPVMQECRCDDIAIFVHEAGQVLGNEATVPAGPSSSPLYRQVERHA